MHTYKVTQKLLSCFRFLSLWLDLLSVSAERSSRHLHRYAVLVRHGGRVRSRVNFLIVYISQEYERQQTRRSPSINQSGMDVPIYIKSYVLYGCYFSHPVSSPKSNAISISFNSRQSFLDPIDRTIRLHPSPREILHQHDHFRRIPHRVKSQRLIH